MASVPKFVVEEEGKRLRAAYQRLKTSRRVTQDSIAKECGWKNASTFNRLLSGQAALNLDSLGRLAPILGVAPEFISPRLSQAGTLEQKRHSYLPVSHVRSVSRGSWGEPFMTELRVPFHTDDAGAFALIFDAGVAPSGFGSWVVVIEPSLASAPGDSVIIRLGRGKFAAGQVLATSAAGEVTVRLESAPSAVFPASKCALVTALVRRSLLRDFRACAETMGTTQTPSGRLAI